MYKILSRNLHQATSKYIINIKVYVKKENTFLHVKKKYQGHTLRFFLYSSLMCVYMLSK